MAEYIDREVVLNILASKNAPWDGYQKVSELPAADVQLVKWIPFEIRDLDEEEKEGHPEWDWILVGELPEDGQRILVNVRYNGHDHVEMDEYYNDDGCYLDSGNEIGTEATHWMPLPEGW